MARPTGGYKNAAGKRIPGVTTVIGRFKDSGALMWWAFSQGRAAERGEIDSLYDKRDEAAESGTLAHEMVEAHIAGAPFPDLDLIPPEIAEQAKQAFRAYLKWERTTNIEIIEQEIPLVSEQYQFGGTPDAIGEIDGELCILDWKTSNSVYPDHLIQLASYRQLYEENNPDRPITGGYHLCRFAKQDGDFAHHYYPDLSDGWEQFKLFLKAYELDKKLKKRA